MLGTLSLGVMKGYLVNAWWRIQRALHLPSASQLPLPGISLNDDILGVLEALDPFISVTIKECNFIVLSPTWFQTDDEGETPSRDHARS